MFLYIIKIIQKLIFEKSITITRITNENTSLFYLYT